MLRLTASVEQGSEHPLAGAVVQGAKERGLEPLAVDKFESVAGQGVRGLVQRHAVVAGNQRFLSEAGIPLNEAVRQAQVWQANGESVIFVAINGQVAGLVAVADPVKPTSLEAVRSIRAEGIRLVMLSGDTRATASAVAKTSVPFTSLPSGVAINRAGTPSSLLVKPKRAGICRLRLKRPTSTDTSS